MPIDTTSSSKRRSNHRWFLLVGGIPCSQLKRGPSCCHALQILPPSFERCITCPKLTTRLRRIQPVRIHRHPLEMIDPLPGKVRSTRIPLLRFPIRRQSERAFARANQQSLRAHGPFSFTATYITAASNQCPTITVLSDRGNHRDFPSVEGIPRVPSTTSTKFLSSRRIKRLLCAIAKFSRASGSTFSRPL